MRNDSRSTELAFSSSSSLSEKLSVPTEACAKCLSRNSSLSSFGLNSKMFLWSLLDTEGYLRNMAPFAKETVLEQPSPMLNLRPSPELLLPACTSATEAVPESSRPGDACFGGLPNGPKLSFRAWHANSTMLACWLAVGTSGIYIRLCFVALTSAMLRLSRFLKRSSMGFFFWTSD
jgi:hypothetical protein